MPAAAAGAALVFGLVVAQAEGPMTTVSLAEYRTRLEGLDRLVVACQGSMGPEHCKGDLVGQDLKVELPAAAGAGTLREVRFGWLRDLLDAAGKPEEPKADTQGGKAAGMGEGSAGRQEDAKQRGKGQGGRGDAKQGEEGGEDSQAGPHDVLVQLDQAAPKPTIPQRLKSARERLREDWERAVELAKTPERRANASDSQEHQMLEGILAGKEYQVAVRQRSLRDRLAELVNEWLQELISKLSQIGSKSKWFGLVAEIGFVVLLLVALVWFLIRLERQGRFWVATYVPEPGAGAASARNWQLWLEDANKAAAQGEWRDAIHLIYWASISRLESSGLWPADRARTPREYLALLGKGSAQRLELAALTRSFERTWYAGRAASESEFAQARQLASKLGAKSGARLGTSEGEG